MSLKKFLPLMLILIFISGCTGNEEKLSDDNSLNILISTENQDLGTILEDFSKEKSIDINLNYFGTQDILDEIKKSSEDYDAVWLSNSIWLYMLEDQSKIKNSKSVFVEPVVFGITESVAEALGFADENKKIMTEDILEAVKDGKLKFIMPSVTQTNSGASSYLGILTTLAGSPEVLTKEDLENPSLKSDLTELFKGVERSSGSDEFSSQLLLGGGYDALVNNESALIEINKALTAESREPLRIIYPYDGVSLSDSPFAYIDNGHEKKEKSFFELQDYLLSEKIQKELTAKGRRAGYGGLVPYAEKSEFNPDWGIFTDKYISPIKYPSAEVIRLALNMYQTELRKPLAVIFCLDYSGSMYGEGKDSLVAAMNYILTPEEASKDILQFAERDIIGVLPFSTEPAPTIFEADGADTKGLLRTIGQFEAAGGTNIYDTLIKAIDAISEIDGEEYTRSVILMTDGESTESDFRNLKNFYYETSGDIPVYSITFGNAKYDEVEQISDLTNGASFDGREDLIKAFRTVRGYN